MKKLLEQCKDMILSFGLAGILIGMVLALLGSMGRETSTLVTEHDYTSYIDSAALKEAAALPGPEIVVREEIQWKAGAEVFPRQAFEARDYSGQELEIEVKQILDAEEQDITSLYDSQSGSVIFPEPGCYYFLLHTMDSQKKTVMEKRPLVVDR